MHTPHPFGPTPVAPARVPDPDGSGPCRAMIVAALLGPVLLFGAVLTFGNSAHSTAGIVGVVLLVVGWLALLAGVLVAGVLVLGWLDRAAHRTGGYATGRISRGLLLFGWFIPGGSLWLPAREVSALLRAAGAEPDGPGLAPGVGRWWACWLGGWLLFDLGWLLLPVLLSANGGLSPLITMTLLVLIVASAATLTVAAVSLGEIMRRIGAARPPRTGTRPFPGGHPVVSGPQRGRYRPRPGQPIVR